MKALIGAVAGVFAVGALFASYSLGGHQALARDTMTPTAQMAMGPDGVIRPYLIPVGQRVEDLNAQGMVPYNRLPYTTSPSGAVASYEGDVARPQYATERSVAPRPAVQRVSDRRAYGTETETRPKRSWQKSALLIGGSAGAGAGLGALMGGKKGAGIGALIGGGSAAIYDQVKRH